MAEYKEGEQILSPDEKAKLQTKAGFLKYLAQKNASSEMDQPSPPNSGITDSEAVSAANRILENRKNAAARQTAIQEETDTLLQRARERQIYSDRFETPKNLFTEQLTYADAEKIEEKMRYDQQKERNIKLFDKATRLITAGDLTQKISEDIKANGFKQTGAYHQFKLVRLSIDSGELLLGLSVKKGEFGRSRHILVHFSRSNPATTAENSSGTQKLTEEMKIKVRPSQVIAETADIQLELQRRIPLLITNNSGPEQILELQTGYLDNRQYSSIRYGYMENTTFEILSHLVNILDLYLENKGEIIEPQRNFFQKLKRKFHLP